MYHMGFKASHAPCKAHGLPCTLRGTWRRERDLNPRSGFKPDTRLAGEPLRPLGHLSALVRLYRPGNRDRYFCFYCLLLLAFCPAYAEASSCAEATEGRLRR